MPKRITVPTTKSIRSQRKLANESTQGGISTPTHPRVLDNLNTFIMGSPHLLKTEDLPVSLVVPVRGQSRVQIHQNWNMIRNSRRYASGRKAETHNPTINGGLGVPAYLDTGTKGNRCSRLEPPGLVIWPYDLYGIPDVQPHAYMGGVIIGHDAWGIAANNKDVQSTFCVLQMPSLLLFAKSCAP
ncbi:uncharacterized protein G2W53_039485 [Senna tora]|uniref:Uncharacterized protein n=1 Tax=Senna tora TaxID=362788 RepID=A0A834SNQ2_9FABA|nr:uncharacterized protein G2W53_039485 [Senna tora]